MDKVKYNQTERCLLRPWLHHSCTDTNGTCSWWAMVAPLRCATASILPFCACSADDSLCCCGLDLSFHIERVVCSAFFVEFSGFLFLISRGFARESKTHTKLGNSGKNQPSERLCSASTLWRAIPAEARRNQTRSPQATPACVCSTGVSLYGLWSIQRLVCLDESAFISILISYFAIHRMLCFLIVFECCDGSKTRCCCTTETTFCAGKTVKAQLYLEEVSKLNRLRPKPKGKAGCVTGRVTLDRGEYSGNILFGQRGRMLLSVLCENWLTVQTGNEIVLF